MKPANNAPIYCGLYVDLAEIARKHGYAMALHGSMARDFDLICIPWVELPSNPQAVVDEICSTFAIRDAGNGQFLTDQKAKQMPKDRVVRETIPAPKPKKK